MSTKSSRQRPETHLREPDAFTWRLERDALLRSVVVGVVLLDRVPDWDRLLARIDRASAAVPHFRDRIVDAPLHLSTPQWLPDDRFDLGYHVRRIQAPEPGTLEEVLTVAGTAAMASFDLARPLWEFTLIEGMAGGQAALVLKAHHGLTDGVGAVQLALTLFDAEPDAKRDGDAASARSRTRSRRDAGRKGKEEGPGEPTEPAVSGWASGHPGAFERALGAIAHDVDRAGDVMAHQVRVAAHAVTHPIAAVHDAVATAASVARFVAPVNETLSPVMRERTLSRRLQVLEVPVDALRGAAKAVDPELTINDAFMAAVLDGMRRYHEHHGAPVADLHVTVPISLRTEHDPIGGNRITLARVTLPVGVGDRAELMRTVHETVGRWREEPAVHHADAIAGVLNLLPPGVIGSMLKHVDLLVSNVPGLPFAIHLAGARVARYFPFGPTTGSAMNITLMSYAGTCCVGINADAGAVPDGDVLLRCLREGFRHVIAHHQREHAHD